MKVKLDIYAPQMNLLNIVKLIMMIKMTGEALEVRFDKRKPGFVSTNQLQFATTSVSITQAINIVIW